MVKFFSTQTFRESISSYLKKNEYLNCQEDLCTFFKGKSIDSIFSQPILVSPGKDFNFIKSRIENSCFNKGKSGGYRLYYYVDRLANSVYLLGLYPKTGKYGREDLSDTELKILIRNFSKEKKLASLIKHDIDNGFRVIP